LRVTDAFGCKDDTLWSQIMVHPIPDAHFTAQPANTCGLPMQVQFNNQSMGATGYEWQLGNGLTSTATHPSTSYGTAGTISVRLIAISNFLCKDTTLERFDLPQNRLRISASRHKRLVYRREYNIKIFP
jgi:PKD repeat protein